MSEHLRAVWAGLRNGVSPLDIYCQGGLHLGIMTTAEAEVTEQIRRLMEPEAKPSEQEIKSRFRHVLPPVPKGPRGSGFYHVDRPAVKPLCGGEGTTDDLSWGDSRSKAAREWITCPDCLRLRDEKLGVTKTAADAPKYKEGDRVYRYVWSGDQHDPTGYVSTHAIQPLTIKKVSPKTYRVRTDHGGEFRLPHHHIEGYVDWEDD